AKERRLAGARLADELRDRLRRRQPVLEMAQRLAMLRREEQKLRVRRQLERRFAKAVIPLVHRLLARGPAESSSRTARARRPSSPAGTSRRGRSGGRANRTRRSTTAGSARR